MDSNIVIVVSALILNLVILELWIRDSRRHCGDVAQCV